MRTIKFCSVVFQRNVEASSHKQDSLMRGVSSSITAINKRRRYSYTSDECHQFATVRRHSVYNT